MSSFQKKLEQYRKSNGRKTTARRNSAKERTSIRDRAIRAEQSTNSTERTSKPELVHPYNSIKRSEATHNASTKATDRAHSNESTKTIERAIVDESTTQRERLNTPNYDAAVSSISKRHHSRKPAPAPPTPACGYWRTTVAIGSYRRLDFHLGRNFWSSAQEEEQAA
jgi:hypothetical protein